MSTDQRHLELSDLTWGDMPLEKYFVGLVNVYKVWKSSGKSLDATATAYLKSGFVKDKQSALKAVKEIVNSFEGYKDAKEFENGMEAVRGFTVLEINDRYTKASKTFGTRSGFELTDVKVKDDKGNVVMEFDKPIKIRMVEKRERVKDPKTGKTKTITKKRISAKITDDKTKAALKIAGIGIAVAIVAALVVGLLKNMPDLFGGLKEFGEKALDVPVDVIKATGEETRKSVEQARQIATQVASETERRAKEAAAEAERVGKEAAAEAERVAKEAAGKAESLAREGAAKIESIAQKKQAEFKAEREKREAEIKETISTGQKKLERKQKEFEKKAEKTGEKIGKEAEKAGKKIGKAAEEASQKWQKAWAKGWP